MRPGKTDGTYNVVGQLKFHCKQHEGGQDGGQEGGLDGGEKVQVNTLQNCLHIESCIKFFIDCRPLWHNDARRGGEEAEMQQQHEEERRLCDFVSPALDENLLHRLRLCQQKLSFVGAAVPKVHKWVRQTMGVDSAAEHGGANDPAAGEAEQGLPQAEADVKSHFVLKGSIFLELTVFDAWRERRRQQELQDIDLDDCAGVINPKAHAGWYTKDLDRLLASRAHSRFVVIQKKEKLHWMGTVVGAFVPNDEDADAGDGSERASDPASSHTTPETKPVQGGGARSGVVVVEGDAVLGCPSVVALTGDDFRRAAPLAYASSHLDHLMVIEMTRREHESSAEIWIEASRGFLLRPHWSADIYRGVIGAMRMSGKEGRAAKRDQKSRVINKKVDASAAAAAAATAAAVTTTFAQAGDEISTSAASEGDYAASNRPRGNGSSTGSKLLEYAAADPAEMKRWRIQTDEYEWRRRNAKLRRPQGGWGRQQEQGQEDTADSDFNSLDRTADAMAITGESGRVDGAGMIAYCRKALHAWLQCVRVKSAERKRTNRMQRETAAERRNQHSAKIAIRRLIEQIDKPGELLFDCVGLMMRDERRDADMVSDSASDEDLESIASANDANKALAFFLCEQVGKSRGKGRKSASISYYYSGVFCLGNDGGGDCQGEGGIKTAPIKELTTVPGLLRWAMLRRRFDWLQLLVKASSALVAARGADSGIVLDRGASGDNVISGDSCNLTVEEVCAWASEQIRRAKANSGTQLLTHVGASSLEDGEGQEGQERDERRSLVAAAQLLCLLLSSLATTTLSAANTSSTPSLFALPFSAAEAQELLAMLVASADVPVAERIAGCALYVVGIDVSAGGAGDAVSSAAGAASDTTSDVDVQLVSSLVATLIDRCIATGQLKHARRLVKKYHRHQVHRLGTGFDSNGTDLEGWSNQGHTARTNTPAAAISVKTLSLVEANFAISAVSFVDSACGLEGVQHHLRIAGAEAGAGVVVGIDCEWEPVPGSPISILQIAFVGPTNEQLPANCTTSKVQVYIIDLASLSTSAHGISAVESFLALLFAPNSSTGGVIAIGFEMHNDAVQLQRAFPRCPPVVAVDLGAVHAMGGHDYLDPSDFLSKERATILGHSLRSQSVGLSAVCAQHLGVSLSKAQQCSHWQQRPLSAEQLEYAALDAFVLLPLLAAMLGAAAVHIHTGAGDTNNNLRTETVSLVGNAEVLFRSLGSLLQNRVLHKLAREVQAVPSQATKALPPPQHPSLPPLQPVHVQAALRALDLDDELYSIAGSSNAEGIPDGAVIVKTIACVTLARNEPEKGMLVACVLALHHRVDLVAVAAVAAAATTTSTEAKVAAPTPSKVVMVPEGRLVDAVGYPKGCIGPVAWRGSNGLPQPAPRVLVLIDEDLRDSSFILCGAGAQELSFAAAPGKLATALGAQIACIHQL
jgi:prolyl-tRNA editing enzyme YbaK/EbsC (Cys-tRNA(Pro) deacylase)